MPIPKQIFGALVTEKVRSLGAKLINTDGEVFMHPLETRDVEAAAIIRECSPTANKGVDTRNGKAVWLDTPMIEQDSAAKAPLRSACPPCCGCICKYDIDMRKVPILVYPTLHYQNGGLEIDANGDDLRA